MREFVAVRSCFEEGNFGIGKWSSPQFSSSLRNQLLLFDKIGIVNLEMYLIPVRVFDRDCSDLLGLEYLEKNGIVFDYNIQRSWSDATRLIQFQQFLREQGMGDYPISVNNAHREKLNATVEFVNHVQSILEMRLLELQKLDPNNSAHFAKIEELVKEGIPATDQLIDETRERMLEDDSIDVRLVALWMAQFENSEVIPLLPYREYLQEIPGTRKTETIKIVIKELPVPEEDTPWERIIDYRNGPYFREDRNELRGWITNVSYSNLPKEEIAEQLERLLYKYRKHLEVHGMKTKVGILETLIKITFGVAGHLLDQDFSKIAIPLIDIIKTPIMLLDAESNAPGKEVSYIIKTQSAFS
jgi:hypothetical protein